MSAPNFRLDNRVALVTGGGSGIGQASAVALAGSGAAVVVADRNEVGAQQTVAAIVGQGGRATAIACDVTNSAQVAAVVAKTVDTYGQLDVLLNNAGVTSTYHILDLPESEWDRVVDINLKGVFLCSQAAARVMVPRGSGSIINISSQLGDIGRADRVHYCASKGGVKMFTKALALDLAPHGVRVNAVAPGPIQTPMTDPNLRDPEFRAKFLTHVPLGRMGEPPNIAAAVVFLASDAAAFVTGATLFVDGGYTAM